MPRLLCCQYHHTVQVAKCVSSICASATRTTTTSAATTTTATTMHHHAVQVTIAYVALLEGHHHQCMLLMVPTISSSRVFGLLAAAANHTTSYRGEGLKVHIYRLFANCRGPGPAWAPLESIMWQAIGYKLQPKYSLEIMVGTISNMHWWWWPSSNAAYTGYSDCNLDCMVVAVVLVAVLVGVVPVALAHILETHFVTCTVWWW